MSATDDMLRRAISVLAEVRDWSDNPQVKGAFLMAALHSWGEVEPEYAARCDRMWKEVDDVLQASENYIPTEQRVLEMMQKRKQYGATELDIAETLSVEPRLLLPVLRRLLESGRIYQSGTRTSTHNVWLLNTHHEQNEFTAIDTAEESEVVDSNYFFDVLTK